MIQAMLVAAAVAASGCSWASTCSCSCGTCKNKPYHCGSHGSGCHMNCS